MGELILRALDWIPRAGGVAGILVAVIWGTAASVGVADAGEWKGLALVAACGILVVVTPVAAICLGGLNYLAMALVASPIRKLVHRVSNVRT